MKKLKSKKFFKPLCVCLIVITALGILGCGAVFGIDAYVRGSTRDRILTQEQAQKLTDVDCIVVLGCLVRDDGTPSHMLEDRLKQSVALYHGGAAPKLLMSGDHGTVSYDEVDAMKQYAVDAGIPSVDIFMDHAGFSTYETVYRAKEIFGAEDVRRALQQSDGTVTVEITRNGKNSQLKITPQITRDGPRLGVYLRQGITGIGTVTWYDPQTGQFGTLGHGVNDCSGNLLPMESGYVYRARVMAVKKGKIGEPGQLIGALESPEPAGTLTANTPRGVFGTSQDGWDEKAVEVANAQEVKTGDAVIRSTVSGNTVREYSVKIMKIYPKTRTAGRNLLLKITDPALLEATGGIVQGMSGSPILQDGKLIGAVTHVLVNDPTMGYGILIENMLDAAA